MLPLTDIEQRTWEIPRIPEGQAEHARALASVYDYVADTARSTLHSTAAARATMGDPTWGAAATAFDHVLDELGRDTALLISAAETTAVALRRFADEVERAAHHHRFSLSRMLAAGAVLAGGGALIVLTCGVGALAVGALEAAAIDAAATAATVAAESAAAAGESAAVELTTLGRVFAGVRELTPFVAPAIARFELNETRDAAWSVLTTGHFSFDFSRDHLIAALLASAVGGGAGAFAGRQVAEAPLLLRIGVPSLASGITGATASDGYTKWRTGEGDAWTWARDSATGSAGSALGHEEMPLPFKWTRHFKSPRKNTPTAAHPHGQSPE
jgi:uncharacterized protein YukE